MKLYASGPMSNLPSFNYPAFAEATARLRAAGYQVVSPHEMDQELFPGFNPDTDTFTPEMREKALEADLRVIEGCDGVAILPGWTNSKGAVQEVAHAVKVVNIPVLALETWLARPIAGDDGEVKEEVVTPVVSLWPDREYEQRVGLARGEERRVTSETGGQKGQKLAQLGAIDATALLRLAEVAGMGAEKYDRFNFLRGYPWSLSIDALFRHLLAFLAGEDLDPESGLPHTAHVAWHALTLTAFLEHGLGTDDRWRAPEPPQKEVAPNEAVVDREALALILGRYGDGNTLVDAESSAAFARLMDGLLSRRGS